MRQKLIFLDIDGTLTVPGTNLPPESARTAIRAAQRRGHRVFLCTGRNRAMLSPLLACGPFDGIVCSAGGHVECGGEILYDHPMTDGQRDRILDILGRHGVFRIVEAGEITYADENAGEILDGEFGGNSEIERWRKALLRDLGTVPLSAYDGRPVYKVVFMCQDLSQLQEAREKLEGEFEFCFQSAFTQYCINGELINRAFDKGSGIRRICEHLGVPLADTVGFGDSMNDRAMMETVGESVCMGNGTPELMRLCRRVCPPVDQDGLAKGFAALGLTEGEGVPSYEPDSSEEPKR